MLIDALKLIWFVIDISGCIVYIVDNINILSNPRLYDFFDVKFLVTGIF